MDTKQIEEIKQDAFKSANAVSDLATECLMLHAALEKIERIAACKGNCGSKVSAILTTAHYALGKS